MISKNVMHEELKDIAKAMDHSTAMQQLVYAHDEHYRLAKFRLLTEKMAKINKYVNTLNEIHQNFLLSKIDENE